ncbi:MAG: DUF5050 domain-containing protein [Agathobacter sp.]|nr:DUF5050 domain-containing protein [Agathobacter sp.]
MSKRTRSITIFIVICLAAIGAFFLVKYITKVRYNDSYVNGNTSGNLYNAGLFCENNGTIFFANPNDNNKLYSMNTTGEKAKKLCDDTVMYINADSNYVYYVRDNNSNGTDYSFFSYNRNSLCRMSRKGGKITILDGDPCLYASLVGNYVYYLHYDTETSTTLRKVGIDGKNKQQVSDSFIFNCSTDGQYFYYNDKNGALCRYDTSTDTTNKLLDCHCYKPLIVGSDNVYYIDVDNGNAITHNNISSNKPKVVTEENVELYNVYGSYIYYQRGGDDPALCMIKNDGTEYKEIIKGTYTNINVTSYYIYFSNYETGEMLRMPVSEPGNFSSFSPSVEK